MSFVWAEASLVQVSPQRGGTHMKKIALLSTIGFAVALFVIAGFSPMVDAQSPGNCGPDRVGCLPPGYACDYGYECCSYYCSGGSNGVCFVDSDCPGYQTGDQVCCNYICQQSCGSGSNSGSSAVSPGTCVLVAQPPLQALDVINRYIQNLPNSAFNERADSRKKSFLNKISEIEDLIKSGKCNSAINKLENDIRAKADGNANSWITDESAQTGICRMIDYLIAGLGVDDTLK
jgi:hypothetical protein